MRLRRKRTLIEHFGPSFRPCFASFALSIQTNMPSVGCRSIEVTPGPGVKPFRNRRSTSGESAGWTSVSRSQVFDERIE